LIRDEGEDGRGVPLTLLESGLTPEQFEKIPVYSGSHAMCPTCSQRLNTNPMSLEELEALPVPKET